MISESGVAGQGKGVNDFEGTIFGRAKDVLHRESGAGGQHLAGEEEALEGEVHRLSSGSGLGGEAGGG